MKYFFFAIFITITINSFANDAEIMMRELIWQKRVLLVFAPDNTNINYHRQNLILSEIAAGMKEREMMTIRAIWDSKLLIDNNEQSLTANVLYQYFFVAEKQFRVMLVGKDGKVKLDRNKPVLTKELFALIDEMPIRQHEMQQDD